MPGVVACAFQLLELADDVQVGQGGDGVLGCAPGMPVASIRAGTLVAVWLSISQATYRRR
jgi:hypothetical protein